MRQSTNHIVQMKLNHNYVQCTLSMSQVYPLVRLNHRIYDSHHDLVVVVVVVGDVGQEELKIDNIANTPVDHIVLVCKLDNHTIFLRN